MVVLVSLVGGRSVSRSFLGQWQKISHWMKCQDNHRPSHHHHCHCHSPLSLSYRSTIPKDTRFRIALIHLSTPSTIQSPQVGVSAEDIIFRNGRTDVAS